MPRVKREKLTEIFKYGTINTIGAELIKRGASSASNNFITGLDRIELTRGRKLIGSEESGNDPVLGLHTAYMQDGTEVVLRRQGTNLQYYNGSTWTNIKTDLTDGEPMSFANVVVPAGHMVYMACSDGLFKLYTANPTSIINLSDGTANPNVRAKILFNKSRLIAWGYKTDPTGLYFSKVDRDSYYSSIDDEAIGALGSTEYTHTTANTQIFGALITDGTQVITDDKNGNLIGNGTGTVNYATGELDITFNSITTGAVVVDYIYETPKSDGLADFSYSGTRVAGEGNIQRQDSLGAQSMNVVVFNGTYFTLQDKGSWYVDINSADDQWDNQIHHREAGTPTTQSSASTANGIVYIDTFDPENPKLKMLAYDKYNELVVPYTLSEDKNGVGFKMSDYEYDKSSVYKFGDLVIISCRTSNSSVNNKTIVYNLNIKSFDVLENGYDYFTISDNKLWAGDSSSPNVYEIFSGFDDLDYDIDGEWESGNDRLDSEQLKKVKRYQAEGFIGLDQSYQVYASYDDDDYELLGTVEGSGGYVDQGNSILVGASLIGDEKVGGGDTVEAYHYKTEFKIHTPKFVKRKIKIVPTGLGYLDIRGLKDSDIRLKGHKLPKKYRSTTIILLESQYVTTESGYRLTTEADEYILTDY